MSAGNRNHRVTITQKTRTADDYGQGIETSSTYRTVWAGIQPMAGYEKERAGKLTSDQMHVVTIRRDDDVTADMEITWGTRTLKIVSAEPNDRTHETRIICEEEKAV